jgi:hypothetical protein
LACVYNCYWKNSKIILKDGNFGQQVLIKTWILYSNTANGDYPTLPAK